MVFVEERHVFLFVELIVSPFFNCVWILFLLLFNLVRGVWFFGAGNTKRLPFICCWNLSLGGAMRGEAGFVEDGGRGTYLPLLLQRVYTYIHGLSYLSRFSRDADGCTTYWPSRYRSLSWGP